MQVVEDEELVLQKGIQPTARITKIIQQVIDKHKLKDTVYDFTMQFYNERGIKFTMDYYNYLVDYNKCADWVKVQKNKNLKENEIDKNPTKMLG